MSLFGRIKKEHWNEIIGVLIVIFAIWMLISLIGFGGSIGNSLKYDLLEFIGYVSYLLVIIICYWGVSLFLDRKRGILSGLFGTVCLIISGLMLMSLLSNEPYLTSGILGSGLNKLCKRTIGTPGLLLSGLVFFILGITLSAELTVRHIFYTIYTKLRRKEPISVRKKHRTITPSTSAKTQKPVSTEPVSDTTVVLSESYEDKTDDELYLRNPSTVGPYVLPKLSLLNKNIPENEQLTKSMLQETARILERSFKDFNIDAKVLRVNRGPAVTRYEVEPGPGVKVSKFVNLSDDLALVLRATRVRVVAPVPGAGVVGIEVPNEKVMQVGLREVLESQEFRNTKARLPLPLGKDISGTPIVADLATMPHLLVAGTTGSGKSVFINSVIASMLFRMTPDELRFLMIDPKRVELSLYDGIPHLIAPVVTDSTKAPAYLRWALREVDKRYKRLADIGVRNIESYNKYMDEHPEVIGKPAEEDNLIHGKMSYIMIIIDELADLMMVSSTDVEASITRLAQIARAAGVHMLVATQRPSVDVVTGIIKANLPCRLSFRLASKVDSRTILDMNGAENLLGKGDMLFMDVNTAKPIRIQGCYISEGEIERIVEFTQQNALPSDNDISDIDEEESQDDSDDDIYEQAVKLVIKHQTASTSFLQRKLNISYDRAVQLLEDMEAEGIVGPNMGKQSREILIDDED
ncbi:TPA: DNA translocase FtsK [Candidatus Poribacteria bacterium]|nr:DNA translocase FtsK [Candidatus Poribacteria bacterium]